jgi:hypothetical protein
MPLNAFGRDPSSVEGDRFSLNFHGWRFIHAIADDVCNDISNLGDYDIGCGPENQETCNKLADRFDDWLETKTEGESLKMNASANECLPPIHPILGNVSDYNLSDETLREWIQFLRSCGGFWYSN